MTRKVFLFEILLIAAASVATVAAYPHLPDRVATHWNIHLRPNGYSPKWALFLFGPGLMSGIALFTGLGPWLSPKNFEVDTFRSAWRQIMLMMFCMMAYFYAAILWAGVGHRIDIGRVIMAGVCLILALMGNLMGKVRRNFYIGVRTPWTLASERVWNATHRFAAKTFVAGGLLGLVLSIADLHPWPVIVLLAGTLAPVIYSLVFYKQLERRGEL
jgi:uncharacterized membrane protein